MPRIKIVTLATLYEAAGRFEHTIEVPDGATIMDAIRELARRIPALEDELFDEHGRLRGDITVLVNGRPATAVGGLDARVGDGDTIHLIPPAGGGSRGCGSNGKYP